MYLVMQETFRELMQDVASELNKLADNDSYWGSPKEVDNSNAIHQRFLDLRIVDQDWYDDRLRMTDQERYSELLFELGKESKRIKTTFTLRQALEKEVIYYLEEDLTVSEIDSITDKVAYETKELIKEEIQNYLKEHRNGSY